MSEAQHAAMEARLEAALWSGEALTPTEARQLELHLVECARCRARYDRLALAARALEPGEERSAGERALSEASFLGALDELLERESGATAAPSAAPVISLSALRARRAAAALVLLAACGLAVWGVQRAQPELGEDDGFTARSIQRIEERAARADAPRVEVFCVTHDAADEARFVGADESPLGVVSCARDAQLQVAYEVKRGSALRYAAFFGVSEAGQALWYGPSPASPDAFHVEQRGELVPSGETLRLAVNHDAGMVRVYGLFSEQPLDHGAVTRLVGEPSRWLSGAGARSARGAGLEVAEAALEVVEVER